MTKRFDIMNYNIIISIFQDDGGVYLNRLNSVRREIHACRAEGYPISERALRTWVRDGLIPSVAAGKRTLVYHENVLRFLRGETEVGR